MPKKIELLGKRSVYECDNCNKNRPLVCISIYDGIIQGFCSKECRGKFIEYMNSNSFECG